MLSIHLDKYASTLYTGQLPKCKEPFLSSTKLHKIIQLNKNLLAPNFDILHNESRFSVVPYFLDFPLLLNIHL